MGFNSSQRKNAVKSVIKTGSSRDREVMKAWKIYNWLEMGLGVDWKEVSNETAEILLQIQGEIEKMKERERKKAENKFGGY